MLLAMGFSINVLTMFGMVLVIGIVVDDAIVVVENVERIMSEEGLPPLEATRKAMGQISGRHHRHHRGADLGVRAAGLLQRLGRQHLPPVLGGDGVDRVLGLPGAVAHAGAVRHAAQAGGSRATTTPKPASSAGSTAAFQHRQGLRGRGGARCCRALAAT
jgi:hypothetical protein